ncbi:hypothetical protein BDA99DRAFT_502608 [Phascolomyces articulosus]|uniref:DNA polymerase eta n=1 Tax=Phascolomyces articulosus TaxID=60185 RepID=A0AAD5PIG0_9FUNG|nr:hypothetical protein BDA99DRAFT_502608 [Phascolomyces articulosus]
MQQAHNDLPHCLKGSRCIVHIDLDCFFVQVEQVRLGITSDIPAAVQQWKAIIAVNYPARAKGVKRMMTIYAAKDACPDLRLIHVPSYGPNDQEPRYYSNPNRATHKISLDSYREASKRIFNIFNRHCDTIQKIGLDEGYMDLTTKVNQRIIQDYVPRFLDKLDDVTCDVPINWEELGISVKNEDEIEDDSNNNDQQPKTTWYDLQLAIGANIANQIRKEIFDELHYTCSAGIAHGKAVAKLCSSRNKPNNQTILRKSATMGFMRDIPFTSIRNMGGKLGTEVESELGVETAGDIWKYPLEDLQRQFGESNGLWIYNIARGDDDEEVTATKAPKSLMAAKSLTPYARTKNEVQQWVRIMSAELHSRIWNHLEGFNQWPKTLLMTLRLKNDESQRSKSCPMLGRDSMKNPERLTQKALELLGTFGEDITPCVGLSLGANGLEQDQSSTNHNIAKLFAKQQPKQQLPRSSSDDHIKNSRHNHNDIITNRQKSLPQTMPITSQKPKEAGILNFFSKKTNVQEKTIVRNEEEADNWTCDKCFKKIPKNEIEEHTDYHFASELQNFDEQSSSNDNNRCKKRIRPAFYSSSSSSPSPPSTASITSKNESSQQQKKKKLFFS